ncbi:hypothetical protein GCM10009853_057080 [Glycomyces scopariae]
MPDLGMLLTLYPPPAALTAPDDARQGGVSTVSAAAATVLTCPERSAAPEPEHQEDPRKKES